MARKRPEASDVSPVRLLGLDGDRPASQGPLLTRAEARALRRSAPLTHAQLRERLKGVSPQGAPTASSPEHAE